MAMVESIFLDSTVLVAGCIDFGPAADPALRIMDAIAEGQIRNVHTAWHCCLEFYAVTTRLPEELRLTPTEARQLLTQEILPRLRVHQLPEKVQVDFLRQAELLRICGGRIYDAHIAEISRLAGATIVVTDNGRHFNPLLRPDVRVVASAEFATEHRL
jgi:predicted nucleic acid-binding protein